MRSLYLPGLPVVFEVDREVRIVVIRPRGGFLQKLAALKVANPDSHKVPVQFKPRVPVEFLPNMSTRFPARIANDYPAGRVINRIGRAGQPQVEVLTRNAPAAPRLDSDAHSLRNDILPAELVRNAEAVMSRRIHGVECLVAAVVRILIAGTIVILPEYPRLPPERIDSVCGSSSGSPGGDLCWARRGPPPRLTPPSNRGLLPL